MKLVIKIFTLIYCWVFTLTLAFADSSLLIKNARIHTVGAQGILDGASILLENDKIKAIGLDLIVPKGTRIIDASNKVVTPGLINPLTQIGLVEVGSVEGTYDAANTWPTYSAAFDVSTAINPYSSLIAFNRIQGLTRAIVTPDPYEPYCVGADICYQANSLFLGQGAFIHLGLSNNLLVKDKIAMYASFGEGASAKIGGSRASALLRFKEAFDDALDYQQHKEAYDKGQRREYSLSKMDLEALLPVVNGELPLVVQVHRAADISALLNLAKSYSLNLVLSGAEEAWIVAKEVAAAQVPVIIDPLDNVPSSFEKFGITLENAARLHKAGVKLMFIADLRSNSHNAYLLRIGAGNAVAYGLPAEEALKAITLNPAQVFGFSEQVGSLEVGKKADLVVWDGDPLEISTSAKYVIIEGEIIPLVSRSTRLRDRYLKLDDELPPAYRY